MKMLHPRIVGSRKVREIWKKMWKFIKAIAFLCASSCRKSTPFIANPFQPTNQPTNQPTKQTNKQTNKHTHTHTHWHTKTCKNNKQIKRGKATPKPCEAEKLMQIYSNCKRNICYILLYTPFLQIPVERHSGIISWNGVVRTYLGLKTLATAVSEFVWTNYSGVEPKQDDLQKPKVIERQHCTSALTILKNTQQQPSFKGVPRVFAALPSCNSRSTKISYFTF